MSEARESISKYSALTWRRLTLIFLLLLVTLAVFRFDVDALVRHKLTETAARSGLQLDFDQMSIHGLGANFSHLSLGSQYLSEVLIFEQVEVLPLWTSLLAGDAGADVILMWQGSRLVATLMEADKNILVEHLRLQGDMSKLSRLLLPLLRLPFSLSASGNIEADGTARFDRVTGMPDSGKFYAMWRGAKVAAMGAEFALGDLAMRLQGGAGRWQWQLNDGEVGMIEANGSVEQLPTLIEFWPVHGTVVIDTTKISDPYLIAWLPDMGDEKKIRLSLAGTLSRPRLDRVK